MLPEGVLSIAISRSIFGNPKKGMKRGIDQILTSASACCPRQYEHIDIKRVAYNHVTAILQRCQNGQKCVVLLLLRHTFYFHAISQELFEDTDIINTPIESLRPADVAFVGFVDIAPHFGGEIPPKPQFLEGE